MDKPKSKEFIERFIMDKQTDTIREYVVALHSDNRIQNVLGCIRIDENIKDTFNLVNNETYDVYIKLRVPLSEDTQTRLVLTKLSTDQY